jgi:hypothetical protein
VSTHGGSGGGGGGGGVLAVAQYAPTDTATYTTTSTTPVAIDSTNLTVSFTVPGSGKVVVELEANATGNAAGGSYYALLNHTGGAQVGGATAYNLLDNTTVASPSKSIYLTGLTPNDVLQLDWAWFTSDDTKGLSMDVAGGEGSTSPVWAGPATMKVFAA